MVARNSAPISSLFPP